VERYDESVAVAVKKFNGPNMNDFDRFTTKEFTPPTYSEAFPLDVSELVTRMAGVNPHDAAYMDYASQMVGKIAKAMVLGQDKIVRAVELQASQILQTGKLSLVDSAGTVTYELDFAPKAAQHATVGTSWASTADKLSDLESLAAVIRANGKVDPDTLIMGATALRLFLQDDKVQKQLDNQRYEIGTIAPTMVDSGATFYGFVWIGPYRFQLWSYPDTYKHPQSGTVTKYIADDKVVMLSSRTRLDMVTANVPLPLGPDPRVASLLPGRLVNREAGFDIVPNVYCTADGVQIMSAVYSRPLLVPVQIDGFGSLDVTP
jgi:hypothetical protein